MAEKKSRVGSQDLPASRCREIAALAHLRVEEWIELTGVGLGLYGMYVVTCNEVRFKGWPEDLIAEQDIESQVALIGMNRSVELHFPCTPAQLVQFIDAADVGGIHFEVSDQFREAIKYPEALGGIPSGISGELNTYGAKESPEASTQQAEPATQQAEPATQQAELATQQAEPASHRGLTKNEILSCDWPINRNFNLRRALTDVPKWMQEARVAREIRGKRSALWNPALIACCLVAHKSASIGQLRHFLKKNFGEWAHEFSEIYAD